LFRFTGGLLLCRALADPGVQVTVVLGDGRTINRRVATIYRRGLGFGAVVLPLADVRSATASGQATALVVTLSPDTTEQQGASRVAERLRDHPGVEALFSYSYGERTCSAERS
jgi:hypothetical protein